MSKILVSGSMAYDNLFKFGGNLSESFEGLDFNNLSVSFSTSERTVHFGGCAGNIAYGLRKMNLDPVILAGVGDDFENYGNWLHDLGIGTDFIDVYEGVKTAAAFIVSDSAGRQVTIFDSGAMDLKPHGFEKLVDIASELVLSIVGPDAEDRMKQSVQFCLDHNVPFIFDPGQRVNVLSTDFLELACGRALGVIVNAYEYEMLKKRLKGELETKFSLITLGSEGCKVIEGGHEIVVRTNPIENPVDPTGAGDAFRAGFIAAYIEGASIEEACAKANELAGESMMFKGTQNY